MPHTPLVQAEILLVEIDEILSLPNVQSAERRILRFRHFAEAFRETVKYQQGFRLEHEQLIALVSRLLEPLTSHSPDMKRAIREVPGLRDARRELVEYIERAKMSVAAKGTPP